MQKLLVIGGPTATGKTSLALKLAEKFNGELVSADSRQVFKGMDIGTGKDLPMESKWHIANGISQEKIGYYEIDGVRLWGLDLVGPHEEFSVSCYIAFARKTINDIWKRGKLPILVGGTGFYIKGVIDGIETLDVPRNTQLRSELRDCEIERLYEQLERINPHKAHSLNESDRKNPVRLVRAIEVAEWRKEQGTESKEQRNFDSTLLMIGITASREELQERIEERVKKRIEQGVEEEIRQLLKKGATWDMQSMNTLGYKEWKDYFEHECEEDIDKTERVKMIENVCQRWIQDEKNYAKRQLTWFRKDPRITWFDVTNINYISEVEKEIDAWHTL